MKLHTALNKAFKESSITKTELSWELGMTIERLESLEKGVKCTDSEQRKILHFIFKTRNKKRNLRDDSINKPSFKSVSKSFISINKRSPNN